MDTSLLTLPAVLLVTLTALVLLLSNDWRTSVVALSLQYLGVFALVLEYWPVEMATVKLVAGWMAGAVLSMAAVSQYRPPQPGAAPGPEQSRWPAFPFHAAGIFHLLAAVMVGMAVYSLAPLIIPWIPVIRLETAWGALILLGMGMLQLGFTARPLQTIAGLLTALSGFEIIYAALENSTLVAGLLAAVTLSLALVGAYLIVAPEMEETG